MLTYRTRITKESDIKRDWHLFDAKGKTLGRLSTEIAKILIGKNKTYFVPNLDCGDWVVVINAGGILVSGKKEKDKRYYRYTGYPGGLRSMSLTEMRSKYPQRIIEHAVLGMLPKNKLTKKRISRLKVFAGENHSLKNQKFMSHN